MKANYPLKKSQPTNLVEPLVKYLEQNESQQTAMAFRQALGKINELRNKATTLQLPSVPNSQIINKYLSVLEMYSKFALLIAKHFNWNPDFGPIVQDLNIVWFDSFNVDMQFMKSEIHYDIFCCFYNMGLLHLNKATHLCMDDLMSSRKQSMASAKSAYYYFNTMRTYYYQGFINTGFSDTNYSHLEMLECLSLGIIYKNLYNSFKDDQYKIGIQKLAAVAVLAQQNFFRSYTIATNFFMKSPHISSAIKADVLSFVYVESLYHDTIANAKYAKHYENQMDISKDNIIYLIAYQKKALRLLSLGLNNKDVSHLLDQRPQQKKDLMKIKPELQISLQKNIARNKEIYKKQEIEEDKIPPPPDPPKQYIVKAKEPEQIQLSYQGSIAGLFAKLIDNESKGFMNELKQFSKNRIIGLQSAYSKLQKNVETIYNDNFVNYYSNLENSKDKGMPQTLKRKLQQIRANGGKAKIDMQIGIIKQNSNQAGQRFQQLKKVLRQEQASDNEKRNQYKQRWNRPPSSLVNVSYVNQIEVYQKKAQAAETTNQKIIEKYGNLQKYIAVIDGNDQQVMSVVPKVQISKFLEENKGDFIALKQGNTAVKQKMEGLDSLTEEIRHFFEKLNYNDLANQNFKNAQNNKEGTLDKIFGKAYNLIQSFNQRAKSLQSEAQRVGQISLNLNKKNKGDQAIKKEFQIVMSRFNDISNMYRQLSQGTAFYTKLNDILAKIWSDLQGFLQARRIEAQQLEQSLKKGGGNAGPNLPSMYPNQPQQNFGVGFYIPPAIQGDFGGFNAPTGFQQHGGQGNISDMLKNLMSSKPSFDPNIFGGGTVYQSKYK